MDSVFFIASKLLVVAIRAESWLLFGCLLSAFFAYRYQRQAAVVTALATAAFLLALTMLPLGHLVIRPLETHYPANPELSQVDGIVILGGGERSLRSAYWNQPQQERAGERLVLGAVLARQFPDAKVLFTGGSSRLLSRVGGSTEGHVAHQLLLALGVEKERLLIEKQSRNTAENAVLSFAMAKPEAGEQWLLVTSAYHMPRSMRSFEQAGWKDMIAYPVDYQTGHFVDDIKWDLADHMNIWNMALKEHLGRVVYALSGK